MGRRLIPREGLTMEALVAPIRLTVLQPLLTGALLLGLYRHPKLVAKWLPGQIRLDYLFKALAVTFGLGLLRKANNTLSKLMLNNFTTDKTWDWKKEVVVVTGGCGGLGSAIAQMFAEKGIRVIVLDVSNPEFSQRIPNITYYQVDITSSKSIREVAQQIRTDIGDPTVLINNAGIGTNKTILDESEADLRRVFDVNTISHFLLVKEFAPSMIRSNHGHIVTIASMASFMVHAQNVDYAASKASALAFHEGLSQELKSRYNASKIRTTVVHPTWIRTPLITTLTEKAGFNAFILEPATVAEIVVDQVMSGYGTQLILPGRLNLVTLIRGLPSWVGESIRNSVAHDLDL